MEDHHGSIVCASTLRTVVRTSRTAAPVRKFESGGVALRRRRGGRFECSLYSVCVFSVLCCVSVLFCCPCWWQPSRWCA